jgi:hypothetical protein
LEAPSREEAAKRLKEQRAFAAVAGKRHELDLEIATVAEQLGLMLQERGKLSEALRAHAEAFDLSIAEDALDEQRFDSLLEALPGDVGEKSTQWAARFCGVRAPGSLRCVVTGRAMLPETLAHNGVYQPGDVIYLAPNEAAEFAAKGSVKLPESYSPARAEQDANARLQSAAAN